MAVQLQSMVIKGFKSLSNVEISWCPLTILAGPNGSGKSNTLDALSLFRNIVLTGTPPPAQLVKEVVASEQTSARPGAVSLDFEFDFRVEGAKRMRYSLSVRCFEGSPLARFAQETLLLDQVPLIDVKDGKGTISDELPDKVPQEYSSERLALKTAGDFGNRPRTKELAAAIGRWRFYNLQPNAMRRITELFPMGEMILVESGTERMGKDLVSNGMNLEFVVQGMSKKAKETLDELLQTNLGLSLNFRSRKKREGPQIFFKELQRDSSPWRADQLSDGTLRMVAYCVFLAMSDNELPPLLAIEEPESNLHPRWLETMAKLLRLLSKRTQVILTTHSSAFLDCFRREELGTDVSVLLMSRRGGHSSVTRLETLGGKNPALEDWMTEFGLGSAIFQSQLLEDCLEA